MRAWVEAYDTGAWARMMIEDAFPTLDLVAPQPFTATLAANAIDGRLERVTARGFPVHLPGGRREYVYATRSTRLLEGGRLPSRLLDALGEFDPRPRLDLFNEHSQCVSSFRVLLSAESCEAAEPLPDIPPGRIVRWTLSDGRNGDHVLAAGVFPPGRRPEEVAGLSFPLGEAPLLLHMEPTRGFGPRVGTLRGALDMGALRSAWEELNAVTRRTTDRVAAFDRTLRRGEGPAVLPQRQRREVVL